MANDPLADVASTYGWDTVFGIHIADANRAIVKAKSSPKTFAEEDDPDQSSTKGTFGDWQITTGGDGDLINLLIPMQFTLTVSGTVSKATQATATIQVRLNFLPQTSDGDAPPSGQLHDLIVRKTALDANNKAASLIQVIYSAPQPCFIEDAAFQGMLDTWFNDPQNLGDFNHVFATVNLNRIADKGQFQWLQPTSVEYAYSDRPAQKDGVLGVLCMTENRPAAGLVQQLSPMVIPDGGRAGFLISRERLLSKLILPGLKQAFQGSADTDYLIDKNGESIVNASPNMSFQLTNSDGTTTQATMQKLTVTIDATELQTNFLSTCNVSPGIDSFCQTQSFLTIQLSTRPSDGQQTLSFANIRPDIQNSWTVNSTAFEIVGGILTLITLLLAEIAIVCTGGAALIAVGIIVGLAAGLTFLTPEIIDLVHKGDAPAIDAVVLDATAPIIWGDSADFKLTSAGLNESLQLGGDPLFAK